MSEITRRSLLKMVSAALATSALPITIANALPSPGTAPALGCGEEFPFFGAHYPDARCIEGMLWDMDACEWDEDGVFFTGGAQFPCPYCNARNFLDWMRDEIENDAFGAFCEGAKPGDNPYFSGSRFPHLTAPLQEIWRDGYRAAASDPAAIVDRRDYVTTAEMAARCTTGSPA
jgi:hypothetical protein